MIFDVDGTLEDTEAAVIRAYQRLAQAFGTRTYTDEYVRKNCFILPPPVACRNLGIVERQAEALELLNQYVYQQDSRFFPGVPEMLQALREKGCVLAVCTARTPEEFLYDRTFARISDYFVEVMHSDFAPRPKPAPDAVLYYLNKYGLSREQVLFVGDSSSDSQCAGSAGVDFALAAWSHSADCTLAADYYLYEPDQILPLCMRKTEA